jgi:hypothetical protein
VLRLTRPDEESGFVRCVIDIALVEGTCSMVMEALRIRSSLGSEDTCVT